MSTAKLFFTQLSQPLTVVVECKLKLSLGPKLFIGNKFVPTPNSCWRQSQTFFDFKLNFTAATKL